MISATTRVAGVIGSPVRHSRSPAIHNAAYAACGLDWVYAAFDVPAGGAAGALAAMRSLGIAGLSVTTPHKDDVARLVDVPSPTVVALAACNTVQLLPDGRLAGHTTDGDGLVDALEREADFPIVGRRVAVLGAGGAARSIIEALGRRGVADVAVINRTADKAAVAAALAGAVGRAGNRGDIVDAELVINATTLGTGGEGIPVDPRILHSGHLVVDTIYSPLDTPLLVAARERGANTLDGLHMLVYQAAYQFRIFTGFEPPIDVMRQAARAAGE